MLWMILPPQTKLFFLCLFLMAIYTFFSLALMYLQSRSATRKPSEPLLNSLRLRCIRRIHNLRQLHFRFFLLFGVILTDDIFRAFRDYEYSKMPLSEPTAAGIADPVLAFAYSCLIIFTVLHLLQWLVSSRLENIASTSE